MKLTAFGLSDIGVCRPNNEDVWVAMPEIGFFALADGMGGHKAGEIAAKEAIDHLMSSIETIQKGDSLEQMLNLKSAIEKANEWVYQLGQQDEGLGGMGTTLCCLIWIKEAVIYAHVGDSRIYRFRNQKLELLTQDHSLFSKWMKVGKETTTPFPYKNVITRAIGTAPRANPEVAICRYQHGDLYFLCSDGLSDVLSTDEIEKILIGSTKIDEACKKLIETAKLKGSSDNITILMIEEHGKTDLSRQQRNDSDRSKSLTSNAFGLERASRKSV